MLQTINIKWWNSKPSWKETFLLEISQLDINFCQAPLGDLTLESFSPPNHHPPIKLCYTCKSIYNAWNTVWSIMIVPKVFCYKNSKIGLWGSNLSLNSSQEWAILCRSSIIKKKSLLIPNGVTLNWSWSKLNHKYFAEMEYSFSWNWVYYA